MNRWLLLFSAILIFGSGWVWWSRPTASVAVADVGSGPGAGRIAPDFSLTTLDGRTFRLSELRGKPVVLNFWATWCLPCQNELPALQQASEHYRDTVVFAGVDQGETAEVVQKYADDLGLTFVVPMDGKGEIGEQYDVKGLPTTFFIDSRGVIRALWMGEMNSVILAENIAKIAP